MHWNNWCLICVDSYDQEVLRGTLYTRDREPFPFSSLSCLLVCLEEQLEQRRVPQSYTALRRFQEVACQRGDGAPVPFRGRGRLATFEMNVLFRQHSSWQGLVLWKEKDLEESFRSALELILLMDSALRGKISEISNCNANRNSCPV